MHLLRSRLGILIMAIACFINFHSNAQQLDPILQDLIQKGLSKNHQVKRYQLDADLANTDEKMAKAVYLPKVTLNGSYTRLNDDITFDENTQNLLMSTQKLLIKEAIGIPFNTPLPAGVPLTEAQNLQNKNILKSSVDLNWVLFSGFAVKNGVKASQHKAASMNYLSLAEQDKVALKIIETYDQLALVYASKSALTTTEDYLKEQTKFVTKAIENGLATPIDLKKIELAQLQMAGKFLAFEQNKTLLVEVLHQLTGEKKETLALLHPKLDLIGNDTISNTEKRNEIKALEEVDQALQFKSKMVKSNFIPKVALQGHYEFIEKDLSLLDPIWYVGVGAKWNVFDGNQTRLTNKKVQIESDKYKDQITEATEMVDLSIIKSELDYKAAIQNAQIVHKEIELAEETYLMSREQYKNNLIPINVVLDALKDLEQANFKLQNSLFQQRRAVTALLHAKGILKY
ncbi:TolC family protein [Putridiphycobacter roseus]|uniref:TolC family protein n=1 Tax=Putridiphycobacter roseus TaxID=2219161 RepID=A0A2W1N9K5_9FLAO|nr:TolC family protein [Putridiphycobacter roseus]PZE15945.1 TolC family protein [Putridiphycobacter roseus]